MPPLHWLVMPGDRAGIDWLLARGASPNCQDGYGQTPLEIAAAEARREVLELWRDVRAGRPVAQAIETGHPEIAACLLANGADSNAGNPLPAAIARAYFDLARRLVEKGAEVNDPAAPPLAALFHRVRPDTVPAAFALLDLIDQGAAIDFPPAGPPIRLAVGRGLREFVQRLIRRGSAVNIPGENGETALDAAVAQGHAHVAALLLASGARHSPRFRDRPTPTAGCGAFPDIHFRIDLPEEAYPLAALSARLQDAGMQIVNVHLPAEAPPASPPAGEREYIERCTTLAQRHARFYAVQGHRTRLVVFEDDLPAIHAIRCFRLALQAEAAETSQAPFDPSQLHSALPEDFIPALDTLPAPRLIRNLFVNLTGLCPYGGWLQTHSGNRDFQCQAMATGRDIAFYRKNADEYLATELRHEWVQVYRSETYDGEIYDLAAEYERNGYYYRERARQSYSGNHAVHLGEVFLHTVSKSSSGSSAKPRFARRSSPPLSTASFKEPTTPRRPRPRLSRGAGPAHPLRSETRAAAGGRRAGVGHRDRSQRRGHATPCETPVASGPGGPLVPHRIVDGVGSRRPTAAHRPDRAPHSRGASGVRWTCPELLFSPAN